MNKETFEEIFDKCGSDKCKHHGYHRYYEPIFNTLKSKSLRLLEIGVDRGCSINAWNIVNPNISKVFGIGYNNTQTELKTVVNDKTTLYMGDQSNIPFLDYVIDDSGGKFDIIIDDGSHVPSHQKISFDRLWEHVVSGGYYVIEDVETSYWCKNEAIYGYSLKNEESILNYFKDMVDTKLNKEFYQSRNTTEDIHSISFVKNMIIIKKITQDDLPYINRKYRFQNNLVP